jgi:GT2 family glycosyltransferase
MPSDHAECSATEASAAFADGQRQPALTVVIPTYSRVETLDGALAALTRQTIADQLEVIVVDDGSFLDRSRLIQNFGVRLIRHETNRGVAAARNTGWRAATASRVAFLDDDCQPDAEWAANCIKALDHGIPAVGGPVIPATDASFLGGYLRRNNPLVPSEIELAQTPSLPFRFARYLIRSFQRIPERRGSDSRRPVLWLLGANMALEVQTLEDLGGFDERFRHGAEDADICRRLQRRYSLSAVQFDPEIPVSHHLDETLGDIVRRQALYGGSLAGLYRKHEDVPATLYPWPWLVLLLSALSLRHPKAMLFVAVLPHILYARGLRESWTTRTLAPLFDCYVRMLEEIAHDFGFVMGLWKFRDLHPSN